MGTVIALFGVGLVIYGVLALLATWAFPKWGRSRLFGRWFDWQPEPSRATQTALAAFSLVLGVNLIASLAGARSVSRASVAALVVVAVGVYVTQYRARR